MLRNEDHFALQRFSLNLCKLSSLNVCIIIFVILNIIKEENNAIKNIMYTVVGEYVVN